MPVSIRDVALRAGVSTATVSKVLNGSRDTILPATQDRVRRVAAELDYRPNAVARSMRRGRTDTVGFFSGFGAIDTHDPFMAEVVNGLHAGCERHKQDLLIQNASSASDPDAVVRKLASGKIDGLVTISHGIEPLVSRLGTCMPVAILADELPPYPCVVVDEAEGARMAAEHLAARGHRRVLYRRCPARPDSDAFDGRFTPFQRAAREWGLEVIEGRSPEWTVGTEEEAILALPPRRRPTAAACHNDFSAHLLIRHCRRAGIRVPDDLAVVGFDGAWSFGEPAYRLTTIHAPWNEVARTAVSLVLDQLDGRAVPGRTVLPVSFLAGGTG